VLLESGANQNLERQPRFIGEKNITARECGINHPHDRVRALFSDYVDGSLHNTSKKRPGPLQIGRTWTLPSLSERNGTECDGPIPMDSVDTERLFNSYRSVRTSDEDQDQPDNLDLNSFPILESANQTHLSRLSKHVSDDPWSPSNIDSLIKSISIINKPETPPVTDRSAQVNPFPQLNTRIPKNPLETEAGKLWADFGKPKGRPAAEQVFPRSARSEKDSLPETKNTKVRGKNRWQLLKF